MEKNPALLGADCFGESTGKIQYYDAGRTYGK